MSPDSLDTTEQHYAIKSWRYLRLAMVALVVGLFVSIAFERWKVPADCLQTSISAYYYTPVHDYFVAALLGIGVCLFCLRGCNDIEDGLLNLAGMFAPVVALVPTPKPGKCASVFGSLEDRGVNIANNITALIVVGLLAGITLIVLTVRKRLQPPQMAVGMFAVAATIWITLMLFFWLDRDDFVTYAHYSAAIPMFVCILVVVLYNAWGYKKKKAKAKEEAKAKKEANPTDDAIAKDEAKAKKQATPLRNPYLGIGGAMIASSVIIGIAACLGWHYSVIAIEFALIILFAAFWVIQTIELWDDGLR